VSGQNQDITPNKTSVSARDGGTLELTIAAAGIPQVATDGGFVDYFFTAEDIYFCVAGSTATGYWKANISDHGTGVPA
jgi:hypothetical protein